MLVRNCDKVTKERDASQINMKDCRYVFHQLIFNHGVALSFH